jgi:HEAT repeat protein
VRANAAGSLALIGAHDSRTVPALLETLNDPHPDVRLEVIQGFGRLGPTAANALPKLRELLHTEENPLIQQRIEQAIEAILPKENPAP